MEIVLTYLTVIGFLFPLAIGKILITGHPHLELSTLPFLAGIGYLVVSLFRRPWKSKDSGRDWIRSSAFVFVALATFKFLSPRDTPVIETRVDMLSGEKTVHVLGIQIADRKLAKPDPLPVLTDADFR